MKKDIKKIWDLYKPFRKVIFIVFLLVLISQIISLFPPLLYAKVIDSLVAKSSLSASFLLAVSAYGLSFFSTVIINSARNYIEISRINYDLDRYFEIISFSKLLTFSIGQNTNENSGIKQSVINRGTDAIQQATNTILNQVLPFILKSVVALVALCIVSPIIGLVVAAGAALFLIITFYLNNKFRAEIKAIEKMRNENNKESLEILKNIDMVQANAQEESVLGGYGEKLEKLCNAAKKTWVRFILLSSSRGIVSETTEFAVMALGAYLVFTRHYTPGMLIVFWIWSGRVFGNLWQIGNYQRGLMEQGASIKKYLDLLEIEPDIKEVKNPVRLDDIKGDIEFKDVIFKYPYRKSKEEENDCDDGRDAINRISTKNSVALKGVSFKIKSGQKIAFVGESGAGKTTISQLLLRAYDVAEGEILIDGVNIKNLDLKSYRRNLGLVPQDVGVFDRSVKENIAFSLDRKEEISDVRLKKIAKLSCIDRFKHRLEHGFDTIIGEKGIRLSGGERQRVGIARALIKDPAILIFDEATSHLDAENEKLIHNAIDRVSEGRTTIIIAHRLSTIRNADKIIVMDKGRIVGEGSHQELMKSCEIYQNLVAHQSMEVEQE